MKTQLASLINWVLKVIRAVVADPQRVRLVVTVIVVCLVLVALFVPAMTTLAGGLSGGR